MGSRGAYILEALEVRRLLAAQLVADIDASAASSSPRELVSTSSFLYFSALDTAEHRQLYASDGVNTFRVRDLSPSFDFDGPERLTAVGDTVYFWDRGSTSADLWKTDGTAGGTVKLKTFTTSSSAPYNEAPPLAVLGNTVYFSISTTAYGKEVWKTDGTAVGTEMVKDVRSGTTSSEASYLTAFKGEVWFLSSSVSAGYVNLYKTNGTSAGTTLVKQVRMWQALSESWMAATTDRLFFAAGDSSTGVALWSSDGTSANTVRVDSLNNPAPKPLGVVGSRIIYSASTSANNREPWSSDGTTAGTAMLVDLWPGSTSGLLGAVGSAAGLFYFSGKDSSGTWLWKTDGTPGGTVKLKAITADVATTTTRVACESSRKLVFSAKDGSGLGAELWISDGTSAGTLMVKDIHSGAGNSSPAWPAVFGGRVFLQAADANFGAELWVSDGTAAGTALVKELLTGTDASEPKNLQALGSNLLFVAEGDTGTRLYKSDLTAAGTQTVSNPASSIIPITTAQFTPLGADRIFFTGYESGYGSEPWITDSTASGTFRLADVYPGILPSSPFVLGVIGGEIYFTSSTLSDDTMLWKSDGTTAGTVMIATLPISVWTYEPPLVYGDKIIFSASGSSSDVEPWVTDGTAAGTFMLKNISGAGSFPELFTPYHGLVYFFASDQLWRTDGTVAGTVLAADFSPSTMAAFTTSMVVFNDKLIFDGFVSLKGMELFSSDGTLAGTSVFADIYPEGGSSDPRHLTIVGDRLFFTANDGPHGFELWRSDGTTTSMVADWSPGAGHSFPDHLTAIGNTLYFAASTPATGEEPWKIGAADPLPTFIGDINPGTGSSSSEQFVLVNGQVAFRANDGFSGHELWRETADNTPPAVTSAAFQWAPAPRLTFTFRENVSRSFELSDLSIRNLTTSQTLSLPAATFAFDPLSNAITVYPTGFPGGNLPDGNYRVTLGAGSVTDASGNGLAGNFTMDFFVLDGDANRDRMVNFFDLTALSANYGFSGRVWADGDFNGDGMVNFFDLTALASRYGTELPAPADVPLAASAVGETTPQAVVLAVEATSAPVISATVTDVKTVAATATIAGAVVPPASTAPGRSSKARRSKPIFALTPPIVRPASRKPHMRAWKRHEQS